MLDGILDKDFDPHKLRMAEGVSITLEILQPLSGCRGNLEVP